MLVISGSELVDGLKHEPRLIPGQIHIWQACASASASILPAVAQRLATDERSRASRFRFARDRDSYVLSRGILRQLIAAYTGEQPERIRFHYGAQGKPAIANSDPPGLRFNVSHSGDAILLAFAADRELGVDVERMRNDADFVALAETSFSHEERNAIVALSGDQRASLFYEYWTCKEACIKADGRGLSAPLDQFSIVPSMQGTRWREAAVAVQGVFESAWRIRILETIPGYAAAVAAAGSEWDVVRINLEDVNPRR